MENKKTFKAENGKQRGKLFAILGLCAGFLCTLTAGAVTLPVQAAETERANTISGELYDKDNARINKTVLSGIYSAVTGKSEATYNDLKTELKTKGGAITAADIRTASADTLVTFGGQLWDLTYISKDSEGNLIATLWLGDGVETAPYSAGWYTSNKNFKYVGNFYSASYIRSYLNNTPYAQATGATAGETTLAVTDESLISINHDGAQAEKWKSFISSYSGFLVQPKNVPWQVSGPSENSLYGWGINCPNSLLSIEGLSFADGMNYSGKGSGLTAYSAWGEDFVWLPSVAEIGGNGFWKTSEDQRINSSAGTDGSDTAWVRSAGTLDSVLCYYIDNDGSTTKGYGATNTKAVRPAIHFNLTKAAGLTEAPEVDIAALWNSAVQESLDSGKQVTFSLPCNWYAQPDSTYTTSFGDDSGAGFDKGRLFVPTGANIKLDLNGYSIDRMLNSELTEGQVILVNGELEVCDSTATQSGTITGGYATEGGGISVINGTLTVSSGKLSGNKAASGGAISSANSTLTISGGVISNNVVGFHGGGIYVARGRVDILGGLITYNQAMYGGGLALGGSDTTEKAVVNISGGEITYNKASSGGGGISFNQVGIDNELNITGGLISYNYSGVSCGGIRVYAEANASHKVTITGGEISFNEAKADAGGIYIATLSSLSPAQIRTSLTFGGTAVIKNNKAGGNSGGVRLIRAKAEFTGGQIMNNSAPNGYGGGISVIYESEASISGTEISGNVAYTYGGGVYVSINSKLEVLNGKITNNTVTHEEGTTSSGGAGVYVNNSNFKMSGGLISGNSSATGAFAYPIGGGIMLHSNSTGNISGGEISNNEACKGGGVLIFTNSSCTFDGGVIKNNKAPSFQGGGVWIYSNSHFTMNGGQIIDNEADMGAGIWFGEVHTPTNIGSLTINAGIISGNKATAYGGGIAATAAVFNLNGGIIKNNTAGSYGGGISYHSACTLNIAGGIVADNTVNGHGDNLYITDTNSIKITGALSNSSVTTRIGISMATPGVFTSGYKTNNGTNHPGTYFFADNSSYGIILEGNEAKLAASTAQTTLLWQYSTDNANWSNLDTPYFSVPFGPTYYYRVLNGSTTVTSGSFNTVGSHSVVINNTNDQYLNPTGLFEILPIAITWKYSIDGGATWRDFEETTIDYTGETYIIGAFDNNGNRITLSTQPSGAIKDANKYEFGVNNASGNYENETFTFTIRVRNISVKWTYDGASSLVNGGYYWNYDGLAHTPVAVLQGVSHEQAGKLPLGYAYVCRGITNANAPKDAGHYGVTVELLNDSGMPLNDPNIVLSGTATSFNIKPLTVTISWTDEDGKAIDEAEYTYNGRGREVRAKLDGLLTFDSVNPVISYKQGASALASAPVNKGLYTAYASLPANCYNYVLDDEYSCQINIAALEISIEWTGNTANEGKFVWEFTGKSLFPSFELVNPVSGANLNETVEYAPVGADGTVGAYTATAPANAGKYSARLVITDAEGNYTLKGETQEFEITKLGVTVKWKDDLAATTPEVDGDGFIKWEFDGTAHNLKPVIDDVQVWRDGVFGANLAVKRSDTDGGLTNVGSALATAVLDPNDAFNLNFYIKENASQNYKVYKKVLTSAIWTDKEGDSYNTGDTPRYDHGTITGVQGPGFTATAAGAQGVILTLQSITYSQTFAGEWVVDEVNGYKAKAKLSAADYANYEFEGATDETQITFFIRSVSGEKENIDVTWVVFTGANTYDEITAGYAFTYNGTQQFPRALYVKDDGTYEELALSANGRGTDAGNYTARLLPNSKYNIADADFTFDYVIKPVEVTITWQDGQSNAAQTFSYDYNGTEQKPYAKVSGNGSLACPVTVSGEINAGSYTAVAEVSKNFVVTSGGTQNYTINKLKLNSSLIHWDYATDNALTNQTGGHYWIYDGAVHAPKAYIIIAPLSNLRIDLIVTGGSKEIGSHNVYAVLDSENSVHSNFIINGQASSSFEIVRVPVNTIIWEDGAGHTSTNGATLLVYDYDGTPKCPTAYFMNGSDRVNLNVRGAMTDAGVYTAHVTDDFDYGGIIPQCNFEIKAKEVTVVWSDTSVTYNGLEQSPTATLQDGSGNPFLDHENNALVLGTDYVITGYSEAGSYTAEIRFTNKNYKAAAATGKTAFTVNKADLTTQLNIQPKDWTFNDATLNSVSGLYEWTYNAQNRAPELSITTFTLDGDAVTFTFAYTGAASTVGKHTVTARIASAMWRGKDISANLDFSADAEFEIIPFEITLTWTFNGATEDTDKNVWFWNYDGTEKKPSVTYTDWDGNVNSLTVYGGEVNARNTAYTARVDAPANCVFASGETGTRNFEIRQAAIVVEWRAPDAAGKDADNNFYWNFDGKPHAPKAYIQGTNTELSVTGMQINAGSYTATAAQGDGNYTISSGETCNFSIRATEVYVKWIGKDGSETNFKWAYDGKPHAPTAVLCDVDGNVINDAQGNPISVQVTGAMTDAGGSHTARAVDTFPNYNFHRDADVTRTFEIEKRSVTDFNFKWDATGAVKTNDGTYDVYTYEYSGGVILPVPTTQNNLAFNSVINIFKGGVLGAQVSSITEVGEYIIEISPVNGNYTVPEALRKVRVVVTARKVEVVWSTDKLVYNGAAQAPTAYYLDAAGQKAPLDVAGAMVNAGKNYKATASFRGTAPVNYVLDGATKTFEIAQREIPVNWHWSAEWNNKKVTYDTANHCPVPQVNLNNVNAADKGNLSMRYEIYKGTSLIATNGTVKDAGEYKIKLILSGSAAANYKFESGKEEQTFNILKKSLTVTAEDKTVTYGDPAPAYTAVFTGFAGTEDETSLGVLAVQASWLKCSYINRSKPGTYVIGLVQTELDKLLPNYDVLLQNGTLTVTPADRTVIWSGDLDDLGAYYDGSEYKPFAYYIDGNPNDPITLEVVYATYSNGVYTEVTDATFAAVNAGTYYVIAKADGNVQLKNAEISYEIYKREIVAVIENKVSTFGDAYKTLTYKYGTDSLQPLAGDDLKIALDSDVLNPSKYVNGFMPAGSYPIKGSWDSAAFSANYNVVFQSEDGADDKGVYTINKAQIKVTKANEAYSDEEFTSIRELDTQSQGIQIKLGDTFVDDNGVMQYKFIQYAGNQNAANVTVHYSRVHNIGSIDTGLLTPPDPTDMTAGVNNYQTYRERIRNVGCYAINYYIEIDNHETLYGTWTVLMLPESQVVRVEFVKDYEIEYGKPVPENLAEQLLKGGYININISDERFLQYATAKVSDGRGGTIGATTNAGKYTIEIDVTNTNSNTQLLVTYHSEFGAEDTNVDRYVITPKKLTVDWGDLEFDHDGTLKLPLPNVYGFVTADPLVLENIKTRASGSEYEYTSYTIIDNGVAVTVIVAARGNFIDVGGHTLLVTVENGNYQIDMLNGNATVSIKGENITVDNGLPDWLMYVIIGAAALVVILIIVIVVVVKRKRAMAEDDDGFYEDISNE